MNWSRIRCLSVAPFGLGVALLMGLGAMGAQAPGGPPAPRQEPVPERDRLIRQAEELRQAGKLDEAVAAAERALELERRAGGEASPREAEALARLAELHELRGDWVQAVGRRKEALAIRVQVDGKEHWRTADARLALAFAEKVAGLGAPERAKLHAALGKEEEEARLEARGKFAESERAGLDALEAYRAVFGAESLEVARVWHRIGRARLGQGDATGAKVANERAVLLRRKLLPGNHPDLGRSLYNLGMAEGILGENRHAEEAIGEAVRVWRSSLGSGDPLTAMGLTKLGEVQYELRENVASKKSFEEALAIRRRSLPPDHPEIAQSLNNLGAVQFKLGEYAAAKQCHEQALAIRRKSLPPDHPDIATSLNNLGIMQDELREYAAAKQSHEQALAIFRKSLPPDHPKIASSLNNLGLVQNALREHAAAKQSHEQALAIRRKSLPPDHPRIADSLDNLGKVQYALREYAAAKQSHEQALAIFRKSLPAEHPDIATSLYNLGLVQNALREYAAAKQNHEQALAIRRKSLPPDHPDIADSLNNLGNVQSALREFAAAKQSHEQALAIRRKSLPPDHPDIADSLNNLGVVQFELREYAAAKQSFEQALAIRKSLPPDHPDIARSLGNLGNVQYALREYAAAKQSHEHSLAIFRKSLPPDHPLIAQSLNNLGYLSLASGINREEAATRLAEASDIYQAEQLRMGIAQAEPEQLVTAASSKFSLQLLIEATMTAGIPVDSVYDRVVRAKGSVTAQQRWVRQARDAADPETRKLLDRLRDVSREIFGLSMPPRPGENITSREDVAILIRNRSDERGRLEQQLAERSGVYQKILGRARIRSDDVRTALPNDSALIDLVEYVHVEPRAEGSGGPTIEPRLVAFVSRPERKGVVAVPLGPSKELAELIGRWRASYGAGKAPPADAPDPASELRKRLWEPLAKYLEGAKVILISPDGPLNGLPWAALPGAKEGTFLVQKYAFAVVPTPQLLPEILRAKPRPEGESPSLLLAGGIDFGGENPGVAETTPGTQSPVPFFGPLDGTGSEVNDLCQQFLDTFSDAPKPMVLVLRKYKATKAAVVAAAATHRFVHLATHGFFAVESEKSAVDVLHLRPEAVGRHPGLLSGVVFAGVNRSDRRPEETILTALEAAELDLDKVELLVLSACETGLGQVTGGEGVLGLQRAFQLAGARAVVASLWKVDDEEAHLFMREFYRQVWTDKPVSKGEALRQAQLWMLKNRKGRGLERQEGPLGPPPPHVWAAFVLSGDWR